MDFSNLPRRLNQPPEVVVGFTCSSFDLLHAGHVLMLKECKEHCGFLVVGLQSDPTIDRPLKNAPVQTLLERHIVLSGCRYVDATVIYQTEEDLVGLLRALRPDVRILGEDWRGKEYTGKELDARVVFNARNHGYSTTELRKRVVAAAAGEPFEYPKAPDNLGAVIARLESRV